jgi:hypothetical protein
MTICNVASSLFNSWVNNTFSSVMYENVGQYVKVQLSLYLHKHHAMKTCLLLKHHIMKTYWGSGSIAPRILELSIRWR